MGLVVEDQSVDKLKVGTLLSGVSMILIVLCGWSNASTILLSTASVWHGMYLPLIPVSGKPGRIDPRPRFHNVPTAVKRAAETVAGHRFTLRRRAESQKVQTFRIFNSYKEKRPGTLWDFRPFL